MSSCYPSFTSLLQNLFVIHYLQLYLVSTYQDPPSSPFFRFSALAMPVLQIYFLVEFPQALSWGAAFPTIPRPFARLREQMGS